MKKRGGRSLVRGLFATSRRSRGVLAMPARELRLMGTLARMAPISDSPAGEVDARGHPPGRSLPGREPRQPVGVIDDGQEVLAHRVLEIRVDPRVHGPLEILLGLLAIPLGEQLQADVTI